VRRYGFEPRSKGFTNFFSQTAALAGASRVYEDAHIAWKMFIVQHELVALWNIVEIIYPFGQTRIDFAFSDKLGDAGCLFVICEMAPLEPFLSHPMVTEIECDVIAAGASADYCHAAGRAHKYRSGYCRLARMLKDDLRTYPLTYGIPNGFAECTDTL